ncbi:FAD/NAD(P)-binding domain-containing protein [Rickenella mellea]|uniref:FAD/NAD(P)-binding domain-containing protein n=1 Tax=Rickenella mellea TaxID=50990 RepID=A0A4Y7QL78_9AGAM|nr:FAD/NAD(P)-binding domain-containing protein [Rickenella mellea]
MSKANIVILGAGGAGANLARTLSEKLDASKYNLVLINDRDKYVHLPATLRMVVTDEGKLEDLALIPYTSLFLNGNGKLKIGKAASIEKAASGKGGAVVLEDGEKIPFTYLVLATGSQWQGPVAFPAEPDNVAAHINDWRKKFANSENIVIVGGGAVGSELSGELRDVYPKRKITIVHGGKQLLNDAYPNKFRKDLEQRLRARNIDLILGDYIDNMPSEGETTATTRNGKKISADLFVPTPGGRPNTAFLKSLGADVLTDFGLVKVKPTLQLQSHPEIFAAGDIIDFKEQKQVAKVPGHVGVVAANLLSILKDQPPKKEYKGTFEAIFVTNGKSGGAGYMGVMWGLMFGNSVVGMAKSKGLFVGMTRKALGLAA